MKKPIIILLIIAILILLFIYFYPVNNFKNIVSQSNELTTEEINQISKSIVAVRCSTYKTDDGKGDPVFGSGSYLTVQEPKNNSYINILLTNSHVAEDPHIRHPEDDYGLCIASFNQSNNYYFFNFVDTTIYSEGQDVALLITEKDNGIKKEIPLNQKGEPISFCKVTDVGTKLYVFGYPGSSDDYMLSPEPDLSTKSSSDPFVGRLSKEIIEWGREVEKYNQSRNLIVTEGIISGKGANGYFTTAKIDTGNSGGLAVAKENGQVCIVGIPTWVSVGELDNLGIIQPIDNIYNTQINWNKLKDDIDF